jgi:hypothetical protein
VPPFPPPPATPNQPADAASPPPAAAHQGRPGTVYGPGGDAGATTIPVPAFPSPETTGSLTGHILAQGWPDTPSENDNTTKTAVALLVGIVSLVVLGLLVVLIGGSVISDVLGG